MIRRAALAIVAASALLASGLVACNAIVGIQDVRLKKDAGGGDDEEPIEEEDADVPDNVVPPPQDALEVALGEAHAAARKPAGTVKCWGDDRSGQSGSGLATDAGLHNEPVDVTGIDDAVDIAAGRAHTCVARKSGKVSCWGFNNDGQLGNGQTGTTEPEPVDALSIADAVAVAAGSTFSCAARRGGGVACWGNNNSGQLGTGNTTPSPSPISVPNLKDVTAIAAGQVHACAVKKDGSVSCWGEGTNGQLGTGQVGGSPSPVAVTTLPESVAVAATERSTCALARAGTVYCWGANEVGQLGNGAPNSSPNPSPIVVSSLNDAIAIAAGKNHVCAVRKAGSVVCWGAGGNGQLGDGQSRPDASAAQATIVTVSGLTDAIGVGAGGNASCAPTRSGAIACWGANDRGQLGNRSTVPELSPVDVIGYP